jgi:hypothetical protein
VTGKVNSAEATGAGFVGANDRNGSISNCYTISEINAKTSYGFAPPSNSIATNSCYWAYNATGINYNVTGSSAGTKKSLKEIKNLNLGESWTKSNVGHTWSKDNNTDDSYPYPRISSLDHCGDWAKTMDIGKIGVVAYYYGNNNKYSGNGVSLDLSTGNITTYVKNNTSTYPSGYALIYDDSIAKYSSDWTVIYNYINQWGYSSDGELNISSADISVENISDMAVMKIYIEGTPVSVTFKNNVSENSYTFNYSNGTFIYN